MVSRRWRRRGAALAVGAAVVVLVVAAAGWRDVSRSRAALSEVRADLVSLLRDPGVLRSTDGRAGAQSRALATGGRLAMAGRRIERSLPLRAVGLLPGFSAQRRGALELMEDARAGAQVAARLLGEVDQLAAHHPVHQGGVPLEALRRLRDELHRASLELHGLADADPSLWGALGQARRHLDRAAGTTARRLREAAEGLDAAHGFLGGRGSRRYLLALQNNAEMRDQGMVLSYAILRVDVGRFTVERSGPVTELALRRPIAYPLPPGMAEVFGGLAPNQLWQSVNATADFAWSGRAMAEMAEQATGREVDGVIALDVPGLAALLRVVGPVTVEGVHRPIDAGNAAEVLLHELYGDFPRLREQAERREVLGRVAEALVARMANGSYDAVLLGGELATAAAAGHLRLWSADRGEDEAFQRQGLGGRPGGRRPDRTIHLSVQNATATKLDYFVRPRVEMEVSVTPSGAAVIDTEVVVANTAPPDPAPSYQFGPDGFSQARAGQYIARVYFWGPHGAVQPGSVEESGLRLSQEPTSVDPGQERSVRFRTVIPYAVRNGRLELRLVPQPRLEATGLHLRLSAPGWDVTGASQRRPVWDRVLTLSWGLRR